MAIKPDKKIELQNYNTLRLSSVADYFYGVKNEQQLEQAMQYAERHKLSVRVIGEGSNVVFRPNLSGLVLQSQLKGIETQESADNDVLVTVAAGENWHAFVLHALEQGWHGLENLALIPGTVGAAPVQNIGAYGVEVAEFILSVRAWDKLQQCFVELSAEACDFSYRNSVFRGSDRYFITSVTFRLLSSFKPCLEYQVLTDACQQELEAGRQLDARLLIEVVCSIRSSKLPDPEELPNAGSFFKNPIVSQSRFEQLREEYPDIPFYKTTNPGEFKLAAAWLIDKAGLKGERIGNLGMYGKQALVLVNYGETNGDTLLHFAAQVKHTVQQRFFVSLEIEPVVM